MDASGKKWVRNPVFSYAMPGEDWWHVFPSDYMATSVNPNSKARFAIVGPNGIGMYYIGETAGVTIWETVLRSAMPSSDGSLWLPPSHYESLSIARVTPTEPLPLLSLEGARARQWATPAGFDELVELTRVAPAKYARTHEVANELVAQVPGATGLRWRSRQVDLDAVAVVYQKPTADLTFRVLEEFELSSAKGQGLIDDALEAQGYFRADPQTVDDAGIDGQDYCP